MAQRSLSTPGWGASPFASSPSRSHSSAAGTRRGKGRLASLLVPANGGSTYASADIKAFHADYPGQRQPAGTKNLDFYQNRLASTPSPGGLIDEIIVGWQGKYSLLERHHGFIQYLFPIQEQGMNSQAQPLSKKERDALRKDPLAQKRLVKCYELMLDFYGMHLADESLGFVVRGSNFRDRYSNLNFSSHNYLRITRILKCLVELGHPELQLGFLLHVVREISAGKLNSGVARSAVNYWFPVLRDQGDRRRLQMVIDELLQAEVAQGDAAAAAGGEAQPVVLSEERIRQVLEEARQERRERSEAAASAASSMGDEQQADGRNGSVSSPQPSDLTVAAGANAAAAAASSAAADGGDAAASAADHQSSGAPSHAPLKRKQSPTAAEADSSPRARKAPSSPPPPSNKDGAGS